ncbi:MAG: glutamate--cysteine ligase [Deltaproteobacteria bacterium]|nr:glutamate--cysteine ligase [Deltaproteobacteria bacterium]
MNNSSYKLLQAIGVELEYMIVDRETLDVKPLADQVLKSVSGEYESEIEQGDIAWSNELALHVLELKTNGPVTSLSGLPAKFQKNIHKINDILTQFDARLMPSAMHPWMNPEQQLQLWPHENNEIYNFFDRVFNCRRHGWANLQSTHINLSFGNDEEFGRLHAAIRLILPIIPAIAASSPLKEGQLTGVLDSRLAVYSYNSERIPSSTGKVIPERVFNRQDYEQVILQQIYHDLQPIDPEGILRHEWANARGCIARFDRGAIEIRLLDIQETPKVDITIAAVVIAVIRALCDEKLSDIHQQQLWEIDPLRDILHECIESGGDAIIDDQQYLETLGINDLQSCSALELWRHLALRCKKDFDDELKSVWDILMKHGCLSNRIRRELGPRPSRTIQYQVYEQLCDCLRNGEMFV